jgi:hypothetical protein
LFLLLCFFNLGIKYNTASQPANPPCIYIVTAKVRQGAPVLPFATSPAVAAALNLKVKCHGLLLTLKVLISVLPGV